MLLTFGAKFDVTVQHVTFLSSRIQKKYTSLVYTIRGYCFNRVNACDIFQEFEERQLRWEHREVELERQIATLERQTAQIAGAAAKVRSAIVY